MRPEARLRCSVQPRRHHVAAHAQSGRLPDLAHSIARRRAGARARRAMRVRRRVAYGRDGRIVSADADRTVRVWDPARRPEVVLRGHTRRGQRARRSRRTAPGAQREPGWHRCGSGTAEAATRSPCCRQGAVSTTSRRWPRRERSRALAEDDVVQRLRVRGLRQPRSRCARARASTRAATADRPTERQRFLDSAGSSAQRVLRRAAAGVHASQKTPVAAGDVATGQAGASKSPALVNSPVRNCAWTACGPAAATPPARRP